MELVFAFLLGLTSPPDTCVFFLLDLEDLFPLIICSRSFLPSSNNFSALYSKAIIKHWLPLGKVFLLIVSHSQNGHPCVTGGTKQKLNANIYYNDLLHLNVQQQIVQ